MKKLLQELRRRRVFRLAALYVVGAWLVFQIADVFFPAWNVPDAALRYLLLAAILCFPVALLFGWFYDITSDGIVRTPAAGASADLDLSLHRGDYIILAALLVVSIIVVVRVLGQISAVVEEPIVSSAVDNRAPNSLAVLPFENAGNEDETYFSDGVAEEILQRLAATGRLRVKARNSSFAFRSREFTPEKISELLSVRFLLTGSVLQQAGQLQISAALLDHAGFQIWGDTVVGELENAFELQAQITRAVAERVAGEIIESGEGVGSRKTNHPDAYRNYLIGKEYSNKRLPNWQEHALEAFESAIDIDPLYAPPYAGAAIALMVGAQPRPAEERKPVIERNIDTALRLQPNLADAYAARGFYRWFYADEPDFGGAESDFRRAIELDPSHGMAYNLLQFVLRQVGRDDEANTVLLEGVAIDPLNPPLAINAIELHSATTDDWEYAERELRKILQWPEPPIEVYGALGQVLRGRGKIDEAVDLAKESMRIHDYRDRHWQLYFAYEDLGMFEDAHFWIDKMLKHFSDSPDFYLYGLSHKFWALILEGRQEEARILFDRILPTAQGFLAEASPDNRIQTGIDAILVGLFDTGVSILHPILMAEPLPIDTDMGHAEINGYLYLHHAFTEIGDREQATGVAEILDTIREQREPVYNAGDNTRIHTNELIIDVALAIQNGDFEAAGAGLERAIERGWRSYYEIRNDPLWAEALEDPGIRRLIDGVIADLAEQRARVEAANAEHDFKAEAEAALARQSEEKNGG